MKPFVLCAGILILAMGGCSQNDQDMSILEGLKSHDCVLRARVVEVGVSPGYWSGLIVAVQKVKYEIIDVYKGQDLIDGKQVWVSHVLVGGGPVEDDTPRLCPRLFVPGIEVVLFIRKSFPGLGDGIYVVGDDSIGILFRRDGHLAPR